MGELVKGWRWLLGWFPARTSSSNSRGEPKQPSDKIFNQRSSATNQVQLVRIRNSMSSKFYVTKPDIPPNSSNFSHPPPCQIQVSDGTSINIKPKGWSFPSHRFLDLVGPPLVGGEPSLPRFSQVNDEDHGSTPCGGSAALCLHATVHGPPADRIGGRHRGEARGRGPEGEMGGKWRNHRSCGILRPCFITTKVESVFAVDNVYRPNVFGF